MVPMEDSGTHREVWTLFCRFWGAIGDCKGGSSTIKSGFPLFLFPLVPSPVRLFSVQGKDDKNDLTSEAMVLIT